MTRQTTRQMSGRRKIYTGAKVIDSSNVADVLVKALGTHALNRSEIDYLWNYYKGVQPILYRQKKVRPDICNKIVENRANEIVSFKVGYLCGEPIQYVSRKGDDAVVSGVNKLNDFMFAENKASQDAELIEWQMICGTAYRLVLPDKLNIGIVDECPFEMFTLDPRDTFIVYSNEIGHKPMMAVVCTTDDDHIPHYSVYTDDCFYHFVDDIVAEVEVNELGMIPIFEYPANTAMLGSFEIVLPLLDAINAAESNRLDAVEQLVQAFIKFINCDISGTDFKELRDLGAIKVKSIDGQTAEVDVVKTDLNQDQTQTLKDDLYNSILSITGMPNRNGGSSTSDTGAAVVLRDGWTLAESRAKDSENIFKCSEYQMLRLVLAICREVSDLQLYLKDVDIKFTRRNYEAIQSKSQVLISMLQQPKIHPQLAFQHCGMFSDSESAYSMSMEYAEQQRQIAIQDFQAAGNTTAENIDTTEKSVNTQTTEKSQIAK